MDNGELKMENVAILARVPSALRRGAPLCGDNSQFSILNFQLLNPLCVTIKENKNAGIHSR